MKPIKGHLPIIDMGRACGECTACCTHVKTDEIGIAHEAHVDCKNLVGGRCSVYLARPRSCAEYECLWKLGFGGPGDRPDKLGAFFNLVEAGPEVIVAGHAVVDGVFVDGHPAMAQARQMGFRREVYLYHRDGRVQAVLPARPARSIVG